MGKGEEEKGSGELQVSAQVGLRVGRETGISRSYDLVNHGNGIRHVTINFMTIRSAGGSRRDRGSSVPGALALCSQLLLELLNSTVQIL